MSGRSVFLHRLRRASSLLVSCRVRVVVFGRGGEGDRKGEWWAKKSSLVVSVVGRSKEKCGARGAGCGGMPAAEPDGGAHSRVRSGRGDAPPQTRSHCRRCPEARRARAQLPATCGPSCGENCSLCFTTTVHNHVCSAQWHRWQGWWAALCYVRHAEPHNVR